jgi:wyosine [tRNA(Phe)-imidazoG37] synthetase (radical SAM superfamily)
MLNVPFEGKYGFQSGEAKTFPPIIVIETTNVCNLRCIHCPQGLGFPDSPDYKPVYMSWDIYMKAIDEIARNKIILLRFSPDGEALVHPQFLDQIAYAKAKGIAPINLTTNGLTLDNQAIEKGERIPDKTIMDRLLELKLDVIDISLDAATKDQYEVVRKGSDYHRVWSNIHRLLYLRNAQKAETSIMLSIVDQPEVGDEIEQFVEYWTPLVDRVIVRPYLTNLGYSDRKPGDIVDQNPNIERWPCPQFWKRVTISTEGFIKFCVVDWSNDNAVKHLNEDSIESVWRSAEYERMRSCHLTGRYGDAHDICGPCTDWMGMRWDWGFELAIQAVKGDTSVSDKPPPLSKVAIRK